jgi:hypothetical protein
MYFRGSDFEQVPVKNKHYILMLVILILIGTNLYLLFKDNKVAPIIIENDAKIKQSERRYDSIQKLFDAKQISIDSSNVALQKRDSLNKLTIAYYKNELNKIKKFTPTTRISYIDSLIFADSK